MAFKTPNVWPTSQRSWRRSAAMKGYAADADETAASRASKNGSDDCNSVPSLPLSSLIVAIESSRSVTDAPSSCNSIAASSARSVRETRAEASAGCARRTYGLPSTVNPMRACSSAPRISPLSRSRNPRPTTALARMAAPKLLARSIRRITFALSGRRSRPLQQRVKHHVPPRVQDRIHAALSRRLLSERRAQAAQTRPAQPNTTAPA